MQNAVSQMLERCLAVIERKPNLPSPVMVSHYWSWALPELEKIIGGRSSEKAVDDNSLVRYAEKATQIACVCGWHACWWSC